MSNDKIDTNRPYKYRFIWPDGKQEDFEIDKEQVTTHELILKHQLVPHTPMFIERLKDEYVTPTNIWGGLMLSQDFPLNIYINSHLTVIDKNVEDLNKAAAIIRQLCAVRAHKAVAGKDQWYQENQPKAWEEARQFINEFDNREPKAGG